MVWDATTGQEKLTLGGFTNAVFGMAFSPDGKWLAASSYGDRTVRVWDATSGHEALALRGHSSWACCVAFSPDGKRLASASRDRTIKLWDTTTGQETLTLKGPSQGEGIGSVAFSPDGQRLAACWDSTVELWDARPRPQESTPEAKTR
jgi:WD40 repeat protein